MKKTNFLEKFFVVAGAMSMPFIVVGNYFILILKDERNKPLAIFFLIISIVYSLLYGYFSWRSLKKKNGEKK